MLCMQRLHVNNDYRHAYTDTLRQFHYVIIEQKIGSPSYFINYLVRWPMASLTNMV